MPNSLDNPVVEIPEMPGSPKSAERHDAILNSLDRDVAGKWFSVAPFKESVTSWNKIPIIYGKNHPNMKEFLINPEKELERIGGKLVGWHENARIDMIGHPKLRSDLIFDANATYKKIKFDPHAVEEAVHLLKTGKLSHSTGFFCPYGEDKKLYGKVIPNHTLVFEENHETHDTPKDPGAFILNKNGVEDMDDSHLNAGEVTTNDVTEFNSLLSRMLALFKKLSGVPDESPNKADTSRQVSKEENHTQKEGDEMDSKEFINAIEIVNKSKAETEVKLSVATEKIEALEKAILNKDTEIQAFKEADIARQKAEQDAAWEKAKTLLAPGLTHKSEDEAKMKDLWLNDKDSFYLKVMEHKNKEESDVEGSEHANKNADIDKELAEAEAEWDNF